MLHTQKILLFIEWNHCCSNGIRTYHLFWNLFWFELELWWRSQAIGHEIISNERSIKFPITWSASFWLKCIKKKITNKQLINWYQFLNKFAQTNKKYTICLREYFVSMNLIHKFGISLFSIIQSMPILTTAIINIFSEVINRLHLTPIQ